MFITVDAAAKEPLYQQVRNQVVAGIATGQLTPGMQLPSVRALAADLGINLHTVNKAYAVLRDEGYIRMKGRAGAFVADAQDSDRQDKADRARSDIERQLFEAALAYRANGGSRGSFLEAADAQAARAFGLGIQEEAVPQGKPSKKPSAAHGHATAVRRASPA